MTPRCPITYLPVLQMGRYSDQGLRSLDRRLRDLRPLEFTSEELVEEATRRASRVSIQGVQPKLSAVVDTRQEKFTIVDTDGRYILKPPHPVFSSLPENEDLTMKLARAVGIEVPFHGMVYGKDSSL
ncbi:MAG: HipA domain-containing protein, partial [Spirochaetaceae bacterium]|nr:HipA domain-containing protein [Spirochaetaceae bacterium]